MVIERKNPIMSMKGGMDMESLHKFYDEHFANHNDNCIIDTEEYKIRSEKQGKIIDELYNCLCKQISAQEAVGLLNDLNDATFYLVDLYRYHDFKYTFLSGIQVGIESVNMEHTDVSLDDVLQLLQDSKEENS